MATLPFEKSGYLFIESLVNPNTGLVASYEGECYTTIHKNSLAAMAMLHESNRTAAERIFDVFARYYHTQRHGFHGLPKDWEVCAGLPDTTSIHWEGEAAFLLLALNYYREITGGHGKYQDLAAGLTSWLMQRACECEHLVAEGVANTYAALAPFAGDSTIEQCLKRLCSCFFSPGQISSSEHAHILEHVVRGALVFGDTSGFENLASFRRSEIWTFDHATEITAYSAYTEEQFINVEVSAQLLLAWKIWQSDLQLDLTPLLAELQKLLMRGKSNPQSLGLPYFVTARGLGRTYALPVIEPTCYLLFYFWGLNPFAPARRFAAERARAGVP